MKSNIKLPAILIALSIIFSIVVFLYDKNFPSEKEDKIPTYSSKQLKQKNTQTNSSDLKIKEIDEYLKNVQFNGNITIYKNNNVILTKGYGYRDFSKKIKNDSNTMYLIGSANKFVTGLILIQLEEEKKIKLTDNVNLYIPHFSDRFPITIRDLMLHQSGLRKYNRNPNFHGLNESIIHIQKNGMDPKYYLKNKYNDVNYIVLSKIIENVTNSDYSSALNNYIVNKSSLNHTSLFNNINKSRYFTTGYFNTSFTSIESQPIDLDQYYGAGNLYMSTDDISKLMLKLKTKKIVNTETTNLLFNSHNRDIFPKNYRYGFYVYPTHNRIHGNFFGNDLVQCSNEKYVVTLASNYLPKPYNNQVEKHLKHIYIDILKQPYKQ